MEEKPEKRYTYMCNCDLCINMHIKKDMIYCPTCDKLVCPKCWDDKTKTCRDCKK
jgi:hypothetical protein